MIDEQEVLGTTPKLVLCEETKVSMLKWKGREPSEANPNSSFSFREALTALHPSLPIKALTLEVGYYSQEATRSGALHLSRPSRSGAPRRGL